MSPSRRPPSGAADRPAPLRTADLHRDPDLLTRRLLAGDGTPFTARLLRAGDAEALGTCFDGLSSATRRVYGPHPLDAAHARLLCADLDYGQYLRFLAVVQPPAGPDGAVVAYFVLQLGVRDGDRRRYDAHGPGLVDAETGTFAPCVADAFQGRGLGSALLPHVLDAARACGRRRVVLWGGVRDDNPRARHFYAKFGFRAVGRFAAGGVDNCDMFLEL